MSRAKEFINETKKVHEFSEASSDAGKKFRQQLMKDMVTMFNSGMSIKDITSNVNAMIEPLYGFMNALNVSDSINKALMTLKKKDKIDAKELNDAILAQAKKEGKA